MTIAFCGMRSIAILQRTAKAAGWAFRPNVGTRRVPRMPYQSTGGASGDLRETPSLPGH